MNSLENIDNLEKHGFMLVKNFLSPEVLKMCKSFLHIADVCNAKLIESETILHGRTEAYFRSVFMDALLLTYLPKLREFFKADIRPAYSYVRQYFNGSSIGIHRDRAQCEYSVSVFLRRNGKGSTPLVFCDDQNGTNPVSLYQEEGDAVLFYGAAEYGGKWHYRPQVEEESIVCLFMHYVAYDKPAEFEYPLMDE